MEIKKTLICSATQKSTPEETTLFKSLEKLDIDADVHFFLENTRALAKVYNDSVDKALEDDVDCLILVHDDVILEENPIPKLENLFEEYDLVGVAGASKVEIKSPALWHLMGGGAGWYDAHCNLHGCVQHSQIVHGRMGYGGNNGDEVIKTKSNFGKYPHRVVMIDGVFMALNREALKELNFNNDCPSKFHFYDLIASLSFHSKGGRVGVGDILITHESPGLREFTDEWRAGEKYFIENYGN